MGKAQQKRNQFRLSVIQIVFSFPWQLLESSGCWFVSSFNFSNKPFFIISWYKLLSRVASNSWVGKGLLVYVLVVWEGIYVSITAEQVALERFFKNYFCFLKDLFIWLLWVFVAAFGLFHWQRAGAPLCCGVRASRSGGTWALEAWTQ